MPASCLTFSRLLVACFPQKEPSLLPHTAGMHSWLAMVIAKLASSLVESIDLIDDTAPWHATKSYIYAFRRLFAV